MGSTEELATVMSVEETKQNLHDPGSLRRALDMAAAEVVLDAGYPEHMGAFWLKVALTVVTYGRPCVLYSRAAATRGARMSGFASQGRGQTATGTLPRLCAGGMICFFDEEMFEKLSPAKAPGHHPRQHRGRLIVLFAAGDGNLLPSLVKSFSSSFLLKNRPNRSRTGSAAGTRQRPGRCFSLTSAPPASAKAVPIMMCAVFSHYTPGQSWPENRTFVATAVVGFFISQVLHMLLFTLREGVYFLETGPKQQSQEGGVSPLGAGGIRLTSEWQRFSTKYKLKIVGNSDTLSDGSKDERSVETEVEMTEVFHEDGYLSKSFKQIVSKKLGEFEDLERQKKR